MRPKPVAPEHQAILRRISGMCDRVASFDNANQFQGGLIQIKNSVSELFSATVKDQLERK